MGDGSKFLVKDAPAGSCASGGQVCGNMVREGTEVCDGTDDTACPGQCLASCTCSCGNGVIDPGETCDPGAPASGGPGCSAAECRGNCRDGFDTPCLIDADCPFGGVCFGACHCPFCHSTLSPPNCSVGATGECPYPGQICASTSSPDPCGLPGDVCLSGCLGGPCTCGGTCPNTGELCGPTGVPGVCQCVFFGFSSCGTYPTCGGDCPPGFACAANSGSCGQPLCACFPK
jgi:hypothetical protein